MEMTGSWLYGVQEQGKCTVTREVDAEEKKQAQQRPPMDKITGTYSTKDMAITGSTSGGEIFCIPISPDAPIFDVPKLS